MPFHIVIPARFRSSRLPGKPLKLLDGKPMVQHVYDLACGVSPASVCIATDDLRIVEACEHFGAPCYMTSAEHPSGTDRVAEVVRAKQFCNEDLVINVQGDEPLLNPNFITLVARLLEEDEDAAVSTLSTYINSEQQLRDNSQVKVVADSRGYAMYFSRSPIPWYRSAPTTYDPYRKHIGIYAYRVSSLESIVRLPPCELELAERLEQLRPLWHGMRIRVGVTDDATGREVNTPDDLAFVRATMEAR
ncbi:MAG: 3-deoxy-manno-octulosonate cytidylyltransferase [Pseudomonadota bacterium]